MYKRCLINIEIPIIMIRRSQYRLIFNMGIPIPRKDDLYIDTEPWWRKACYVSSSPPGQNGPHFSDDIFSCIFVNEKFCISIKISLKFVPKSIIETR